MSWPCSTLLLFFAKFPKYRSHLSFVLFGSVVKRQPHPAPFRCVSVCLCVCICECVYVCVYLWVCFISKVGLCDSCSLLPGCSFLGLYLLLSHFSSFLSDRDSSYHVSRVLEGCLIGSRSYYLFIGLILFAMLSISFPLWFPVSLCYTVGGR